MRPARSITLVGDPRGHPPDSPLPRDERDVVWLSLDGFPVGLRPIHPDDKSALIEGFGRLSEQTRYQRFLAPMNSLSSRQIRYLTEIDHVNHFAWVAGTRSEDGAIKGMGVARFVRLAADPDVADFAVVVADDSQDRGVGTLLVHALTAVAHDHGIVRLTALALGENRRMVSILERIGGSFTPESPGVLASQVPLPAPIDLDDETRDALIWVSKIAAHPSGR
ncbi:GNAT family N-acetyltransferase [bacterium]|nr:GNAT family N-acetyltransferase [bacterium]